MDVLVADEGDFAWYENVDGNGGFADRQIIETHGYAWPRPADVDGDNDLDVVVRDRMNNSLVWLENVDGKGDLATPHEITAGITGYVEDVFFTDLDADGDADLLAASLQDGVAWYENQVRGQSFGGPQVVTTETEFSSVSAADIDGDGDADVLATSTYESRIAWFGNSGGNSGFGEKQPITTGAGALAIYPADPDGDGDTDVLSALAGNDRVVWYQNIDGHGTYDGQNLISTEVRFAPGRSFGYFGRGAVIAADVDGDGDLDVLSASGGDSKVAWYPNTDGKGSFGQQRVITVEPSYFATLEVGDADGDGDLDVFVGSSPTGDPAWYENIAWYENVDGQGTFSARHLIGGDYESAPTGGEIRVTDMDGDGDLDVVFAVTDLGVEWLENTNGLGEFQVRRPNGDPNSYAWWLQLVDIDRDGDEDVLSTGNGTIGWSENIDGSGTFGPLQVIAAKVWGATVLAADVDGDGDMDLLSAGQNNAFCEVQESHLAWYENVDGRGNFGVRQLLRTTDAQGPRMIRSADADGDGDLDVFVASWGYDGNLVDWHENRLDGDADDDGEVSFTDFVTLANNFGRDKSSWEDGDFNGDGAIGFADFLILSKNFGASRVSLANAGKAASVEMADRSPCRGDFG